MAAPITAGIATAWGGSAGAITAGWTRVASMDGRHPKGAGAGQEPNIAGGSATHQHGSSTAHGHSLGSHFHPGGGQSGGPTQGFPHTGVSGGLTAHTHGLIQSSSLNSGTSGPTAPDWAAASNDPPSFEVIWIESDGTPTGFPAAALTYWGSPSLPPGWSQHAASQGRFLKGAPSGADAGGTAGAAAHQHGGVEHSHDPGHTHDQSPSGSTAYGGGHPFYGPPTGSVYPESSGDFDHSHSTVSLLTTGSMGSATSAATGEGSWLPSHRVLAVLQNATGGPSLLPGMIAVWRGPIGSVPSNWRICDGGGETLDLRDRFVLAASLLADVGTSGGTASHGHPSPAAHVHAQEHIHTLLLAANAFNGPVVGASYPSGYAAPLQRHTHGGFSLSAGSGNSGAGTQDVLAATTEPLHRTAVFIQYQGSVEVTVETPGADAVVASPGFEVTWSNAGEYSGLQNDYRVRIYAQGESTPVYDSLQTSSPVASHAVPATSGLRHARAYEIEVTVRDSLNALGVSARRSVTTSWTAPATVTGLTVTPLGA